MQKELHVDMTSTKTVEFTFKTSSKEIGNIVLIPTDLATIRQKGSFYIDPCLRTPALDKLIKRNSQKELGRTSLVTALKLHGFEIQCSKLINLLK